MSDPLVNSPPEPDDSGENRPPKPQVEVSIEFVTPAMAERWLDMMVKNRAMSKAWIGVLDRELSHGRFQFTHQGIAFDRDGRLFDGQHRLAAIIQSKIGAWLLVVRGLDSEVMLATDRGRSRTLAQTAYIASLEEDRHVVQVASFLMERDYALRYVTSAELRLFLNVHANTIAQAVTLAERKPWFVTAVMQAVIARAIPTMDRARLKEFHQVFIDPASSEDPADTGAQKLHAWLEAHKNNHRHPDRSILYTRILFALKRFRDRQVVSRLGEGSPEDFPMPDVPELHEHDDDDNNT